MGSSVRIICLIPPRVSLLPRTIPLLKTARSPRHDAKGGMERRPERVVTEPSAEVLGFSALGPLAGEDG